MQTHEEILAVIKSLHESAKVLCEYFQDEIYSITNIQNESMVLLEKRSRVMNEISLLEKSIADLKIKKENIEKSAYEGAKLIEKEANEKIALAVRDREAARIELEDAKKQADKILKDAKLRAKG